MRRAEAAVSGGWGYADRGGRPLRPPWDNRLMPAEPYNYGW